MVHLKWSLANCLYAIKYYSFKHRSTRNNMIVLFVDEKKKHAGFVDILKAIVGCYYIAKQQNFEFRLKFTSPFQLDKFLIPNEYNWNSLDEVSTSLCNTRFLNYYGKGKIPVLNSKYQYHIYNFRGWNILQRNRIEGWELIWVSLFKQLFRPSEYLRNAIEHNSLKKGTYISVHVRFVNSIGILEEKFKESKLLSVSEQETLLNKCFKAIEKIQEANPNKEVCVFSDSNKFLTLAKEKGYQILPGMVGHVSYNLSDDIVLKMFVDLFAIGGGEKVYCIQGYPLYNSVFPYYSALMSGKQINIFNIDSLNT